MRGSVILSRAAAACQSCLPEPSAPPAILPYRNALLTAKIVSMLDALAGGRVILGIGVGWMEEEFDALDA